MALVGGSRISLKASLQEPFLAPQKADEEIFTSEKHEAKVQRQIHTMSEAMQRLQYSQHSSSKDRRHGHHMRNVSLFAFKKQKEKGLHHHGQHLHHSPQDTPPPTSAFRKQKEKGMYHQEQHQHHFSQDTPPQITILQRGVSEPMSTSSAQSERNYRRPSKSGISRRPSKGPSDCGSSSSSESSTPEDLSAGDLSEHDFDNEDSASDLMDAKDEMHRHHSHGHHFTFRHKVWLTLQPSRWRHSLWLYAASWEAFSMILLAMSILFNVLDSVDSFREEYMWIHPHRNGLEYCCCCVFTLEYILKIWACVESPRYRNFGSCLTRLKFAMTRWMIFELLVLMAFYIDLSVESNFARGFPAMQSIRGFRLFAVLRVDKNPLWSIMLIFRRNGSELLGVFILEIFMVIISSSVMYYIEGVAQPDTFSSIPATMWWSVTTLTTVGYGDMVPGTYPGKVVGLITMMCGVGLFALPAGILGSAFLELHHLREKKRNKSAVVHVEGELMEVEDELHDIHEVVEEESKRIERIETSLDATRNSLEILVAEVRDIATTQRAMMAAMGMDSTKSSRNSSKLANQTLESMDNEPDKRRRRSEERVSVVKI